MSKLRPFTKEDFYGYAGAEALSDGTPPLIYNGENFDVIVSGDAESNLTQVAICHENEYSFIELALINAAMIYGNYLANIADTKSFEEATEDCWLDSYSD